MNDDRTRLLALLELLQAEQAILEDDDVTGAPRLCQALAAIYTLESYLKRELSELELDQQCVLKI